MFTDLELCTARKVPPPPTQKKCYQNTISLYKSCYMVTHCSTHRQQKLIHHTVFNIKRKISLPSFLHKCLDTNKQNFLEWILYDLDFIILFYSHITSLTSKSFLTAIKLLFKITGTIIEDNLLNSRWFLKLLSGVRGVRGGSQLLHVLSM